MVDQGERASWQVSKLRGVGGTCLHVLSARPLQVVDSQKGRFQHEQNMGKDDDLGEETFLSKEQTMISALAVLFHHYGNVDRLK